MMTFQTPVWRPVDWTLACSIEPEERPFQVELWAVARGPGGRELRVPGFYRGGGEWCVRFAPPTAGEWSLVTSADEPELSGRRCVVAGAADEGPWRHGPVYAPRDPEGGFRHADGTPHFLFGYECDWLWALDQTSPDTPRLAGLLDALAGAHFNHVMVNSFAYDCPWTPGKTRPNDFGPPQRIPWTGTHDSPDYLTLDTTYFDHYDRVMWALYARGMTAHIYLKVYNKLVNWPRRRSPEERLFFDYFVARYQAFPNVVWDFAKECYNEPDKEYVAESLDRIRDRDAYHHPTTVHDDWYFTYNAPYRRRIDFVTDQNHSELYFTCLEQRTRRLGPVVNAEYGYEHGRGGRDDKTYSLAHSPEEMLHRTCEVVMAGAFPVYYYTNHAWDVIEWQEAPASLPWYRRLYERVTAVPWPALRPRPDLGFGGARCRTDGLDHLLLYTRHGGGGVVVPAEWTGSRWEGDSLNLISGRSQPVVLTDLQPGRRTPLGRALGEGPALAYLRRRR